MPDFVCEHMTQQYTEPPWMLTRQRGGAMRENTNEKAKLWRRNR